MEFPPLEFDDELDEEDEMYFMSEPEPQGPPPGFEPPDHLPEPFAPDMQFRCWSCHSDAFVHTPDGWRCAVCSSWDFYNTHNATRHETEDGVWLYMPHAAPSPAGTRPPAPGGRRTPGRADPPGGDGPEEQERGESESRTSDPLVDPVTLQPLPRRHRRRRQPRPGKGGPDPPQPGHPGPRAPRDDPADPEGDAAADPIRSLADAISKAIRQGSAPPPKKNTSEASWNSRMGPTKGIRFRSGAPPNPPTWQYSREDVRAFYKWERKVQVWRLQISSWLPANEAAMMLYTSLRGEAEEETEHLEIEKINAANGLDYLMDSLRSGLQSKQVYQKRRLLADFEGIMRANNESVRTYINRYKRCERALLTVNITVAGMYDAEARGNRLLERARLSADAQRLVLISSGHRLDFDYIVDSLMYAFPDHKPTPPIYGRDGQPIRSGQGAPYRTTAADSPYSSSSTSTAASSSAFAHSGKGDRYSKGRGRGKGFPPRKVYNADHVHFEPEQDQEEPPQDPDALDPIEEQPDEEAVDEENDEPNEQDEAQPDEATDETQLAEALQILTVTANRLKGITLGRKFSETKTIEERKRTSTCSACGAVGHWQGDAVCPKSSKGSGRGAPDRPSRQDARPKSHAGHGKKVFAVKHVDGHQTAHHLPEQPQQHDQPSFFTFTTFLVGPHHDVLLSSVNDLTGYMVLDTACQRTCCGNQWHDLYEQLLKNHRLTTKLVDGPEVFQFGSGGPMQASQRSYFPVSLGGKYMLMGASILPCDIPLLASNTLMTELGMVIDTVQMRAFCSKINVDLSIKWMFGHFAVDIAQFAEHVRHHSVWHELSEPDLWVDPHPELILPASILASASAEAVPDDRKAPTTSGTSLMETRGHRPPPDRAAHPEVHDGHDQSGSSLADVVDTTRDGGGRAETETGGGTTAQAGRQDVHPPGLETLRQQAWTVRSMPSVPDQDALGAGTGRMGTILLRFFARICIAFAILIHYTLGFGISTTVATAGHAQEDVGASLFGGSIDKAINSLAGDFRPGDGRNGMERHSEPAQRLRLGRRGRVAAVKDTDIKEILGQVRKVRHVYLTEYEIYLASSRTRPTASRVDIMETYAGAALISQEAHLYGLKATIPVDYNTGFNLGEPESDQACNQMVHNLRPLVMIHELECKPWTLLQDNCNFVNRKEELEQWRESVRPQMNQVVKWCYLQHNEGRYYILENPQTSRLWLEAAIQKLQADTGAVRVTCHSGAYGARDSKGNLIRKSFSFMSNNPDLLRYLQERLPPEQLRECVKLEGAEVTNSQAYPPGLVHAILRGVQDVAKQINPSRFAKQTHQIMYQKPSEDLDSWKRVLDNVTELFSNTAKKTLIIKESDRIYPEIADLVPWQITRVQVVKTPVTHRQPAHVPFTHRGSALRYNDDQIEVTSEDVGLIHFPRKRFPRPVSIGIFFFGYGDLRPSGQPHAPQAQQEPETEKFHGEIRFPGLHNVDRSTKASVARLHRNLGHISNNELIKLMAMNGITSEAVTKCIKTLVCDTCSRNTKPDKPNPAHFTDQFIGQFADTLETDIAYVRDLHGQSHAFLGIIDRATHLHVATLLESRSSEVVARAFQDAWVTPFGFPLVVRADADGAFEGAFQSFMDQGGTHLDLVPAEAHHRIGTIERHNGTLKLILLKLIDSLGVIDRDGLRLALSSATHAKNSATWSSGRPPYVAAFGRVPRVGFDLLNDERALICGTTRSEAQQQASLLRAEALKALAEVSASNALRRALLRKTNDVSVPDLIPGSLVAFWRWTTRSHHKKGGYRLGRLLGHDPDGRSMWVQTGRSTLRISNEQARSTFGYEDYVPDQEDLTDLKHAENNLRNREFEEQAGEPPPREPDENDLDDLQAEMPEASLPLPPPIPATPPRPAPQDPPPQEPASPITINQHHQQISTHNITQQHFSGQQPSLPAPFTPVRRGRVRSRTPIPDRPRRPHTPLALDTQPAAGTASQEQQHSSEQLRRHNRPEIDDDIAELFDAPPSEGTTHHSGNPYAQPAPDVTATATTPAILTSPEQPQPIQPAVEPPDGTSDVGEMMPITPPDREPLPTVPSKRPFEALMALTSTTPSARVINSHCFEFHDYTTPHPHPQLWDLKCWARLDLSARTTFGTMSTGPPWSRILRRRTLRAEDLSMITDEDILPDTEIHQPLDNESNNVITELWFEPGDSTAPYECYFALDDNGLRPVESGWDGSPDITMEPHHQGFYETYVNHLAHHEGDHISTVHDDSDQDLDDMRQGPARPDSLSRQESKALEKELPWREIMKMDEESIAAFVESAKEEERSWMSFKSVEPVPTKEAEKILADPATKRRVMPTRACYRDKNKGVPPLKAKCRVVVQGHQDPDLRSISRQAPTPGRLSEMIILMVFASGANLRAFCNPIKWYLWVADAKTAFLQGSQDVKERPNDIFIRGPRDPILDRAKVFRSQLYRVVGNVYGLANAPITWCREVIRRMRSIGFVQMAFDAMTFLFPSPSNPVVPCCIVSIYVLSSSGGIIST